MSSPSVSTIPSTSPTTTVPVVSSAASPQPIPVPVPLSSPADQAVMAALTAIHLHSSTQSAVAAALQQSPTPSHSSSPPSYRSSRTRRTKSRSRSCSPNSQSGGSGNDSGTPPPTPPRTIRMTPMRSKSSHRSSRSTSSGSSSNGNTRRIQESTFLGRFVADLLVLPWTKLLAALLCTFFVWLSFNRIAEFQQQVQRLSIENAELKAHAQSLVAKETGRLELHMAALELRVIKLLQQEMSSLVSRVEKLGGGTQELDKRLSQHELRQQIQLLQLQSHLDKPSSASNIVQTTGSDTRARIESHAPVLLPPASSDHGTKRHSHPALRLSAALKTIPSEVLSILDDHDEFKEEIARYRENLQHQLRLSKDEPSGLLDPEDTDSTDRDRDDDILQREAEQLSKQMKQEL